MEPTITMQMIKQYEAHLFCEERSARTIEKYRQALCLLAAELGGSAATKQSVICWKERLLEHGYAVATINGMLAAVNSFFAFQGWDECKVKLLKQQRRIFRDKRQELTRSEYLRLLEAARSRRNNRMYQLLQTLGGTGIRISELRFITVEAVRSGQAVVACKGKRRVVLLAKKLRQSLDAYCRTAGIQAGAVFVTKSGAPMDRSNIWRDMKQLCDTAGVDDSKVFPHNFRHLFAVEFYRLEKDIAKLADLLGHASIETTRIYIMESRDEHIRQIDRMGLVV